LKDVDVDVVAIEYDQPTRYKELTIIDGYKMRFHKMLNGDVKRCCCINKTCTAYMKTDMIEKTIIDSNLIFKP